MPIPPVLASTTHACGIAPCSGAHGDRQHPEGPLRVAQSQALHGVRLNVCRDNLRKHARAAALERGDGDCLSIRSPARRLHTRLGLPRQRAPVAPFDGLVAHRSRRMRRLRAHRPSLQAARSRRLPMGHDVRCLHSPSPSSTPASSLPARLPHLSARSHLSARCMCTGTACARAATF
jgi:hypothetical protein